MELPVVAMTMLQGPPQDSNGVDDDNDGIVDNEMTQLASGLGNDPFTFGIPSNALGYYNWMKGTYVTGGPLQDDGVNVLFQNEGIPDGTEIDVAGDVRVLTSTGDFTLTPGMEFCTHTMTTYAVSDAGPLGALEPVIDLVAEHTENFDQCFPCVPPAAQFIGESRPGGWSFWNISEADTYEWDFGDLGTSNDPFPSIELENGQDLTVTLTVTNECGSATTTQVIEDVIVDVDEKLDNKIKVYPSPADQNISIEVPSHMLGAQVLVRDMVGKIIHETTVSATRTDLATSHLTSGIYFATLITKKGDTITQRFVVQH